MEELGKAMGGKGNLAILIGELSDEPAHGRTDGIKQVVKEQFPNIKVTREQIGHWKREQGKTIMGDWLASGQQIGGVAANNDEMALGGPGGYQGLREDWQDPRGRHRWHP
jgi:inositol transport system substrate-binding protein